MTLNLTDPSNVGNPEVFGDVLANNFLATENALNGGLVDANFNAAAAIDASKLAGYPASSSTYINGAGNWVPIPGGLLLRQTTTQTCTGALNTPVNFTPGGLTVPGGAMGTNGKMIISMWGDNFSDTNTSLFIINFLYGAHFAISGGFSTAASAQRWIWFQQTRINNQGVNSQTLQRYQNIGIVPSNGGAPVSSETQDPLIATGSDWPLSISVQQSAGLTTSDLRMHGLSVLIFPELMQNAYITTPGQTANKKYIQDAAKFQLSQPGSYQAQPTPLGGSYNPFPPSIGGATQHQQVAPPPQQQSSNNAPPPAAPPPPGPKQNAALDYSGDPILGEVKAANLAAGNAQEQSTNNSINQALLHLGSKDLASKVLQPGDAILNQISEDPWTSNSTLGQLNYGLIQNTAGSNNSAAVDNSIFGSAHAQNLFDINRQNTIDRSSAIGDTDSQIQSLYGGLAAYKQNLLMSNIQAEADAYNRAQAAAAASGSAPQPDPTPPPANTGPIPSYPDIVAAGGGGYVAGGAITGAGGGGNVGYTPTLPAFWNPVTQQPVPGVTRNGPRVAS